MKKLQNVSRFFQFLAACIHLYQFHADLDLYVSVLQFRKGLLEVRHRAGRVLSSSLRHAQECLNLPEAWIEFEGGLELGNGACKVPLKVEQDTQVSERIHITRFNSEDGPKLRNGAIWLVCTQELLGLLGVEVDLVVNAQLLR